MDDLILKVRWIGLPEAGNKRTGQSETEVECETRGGKDCEMKPECEEDEWIALRGENIHLEKKKRETNRENVRRRKLELKADGGRK